MSVQHIQSWTANMIILLLNTVFSTCLVGDNLPFTAEIAQQNLAHREEGKIYLIYDPVYATIILLYPCFLILCLFIYNFLVAKSVYSYNPPRTCQHPSRSCVCQHPNEIDMNRKKHSENCRGEMTYTKFCCSWKSARINSKHWFFAHKEDCGNTAWLVFMQHCLWLYQR